MIKLKSLLAGLLMGAFFIAQAMAQSGQLPSGYVWGNSASSAKPGTPATVTSIFDRAFGSTPGNILLRGSSAWGAVGITGDCTVSSVGGIICTKTNGVALGTMATQNASAVAITGGSFTGLATPVNTSDATTKSYVDGLANGLHVLAASRLATAAVLPNTPTYSNGASGVGATLTAGSNSTLTVDGTVANLNDVILIQNQASAFQNGIYSVTTAGSGSAAWVLTRATYFNQSSNMVAGSYTAITAGAANVNASFALAATVTTVGTTAVTFNLFSNAGVTSLGGVTGPVTLGSSLGLTGSALAVASNGVANTNLAQMLANTAKCNPTSSLANAQDCASLAITGLTLTGDIVAASKGHLFGQASGTSSTGAVTTADANLMLYDISSTNWAGIGTDPSGFMWFKTGTTGTPVPAMYIDAGQTVHAVNLTVSGTLTAPGFTLTSLGLNPSGAADALDLTQNLNGTAHYGMLTSQTITGGVGATGSGVNYNLLNITSDNAQCAGTGGQAFCIGYLISDLFGGSAATGGRLGLDVTFLLTAATSASNTNRNYAAAEFNASAATGDNGTNTGAGALGAMFAINPVASLKAGATNWLNLSGGEVDIGMDSTASVKYMLGWSVVGGYNGLSNGSGTAASMGAAFNASGLVAQTFDAGYIISDLNGAWPIKTGGTLQRAFITGSTPTVLYGTDWSNVTFGGCAFKSNAFCVSGNGALSLQGAFGGAPMVNIQNTSNLAGSKGIFIGVGATGSGDTTSAIISFEDGPETGVIGSVTRNGNAVAYNTTSDRRLKENFRPSSFGLADLMKIKIIDFDFKTDPGVSVNGVVAQDLFQVYPVAVTRGGDDPKTSPWAVDYGRLAPLIIQSIQDMKHEIDDLRATRH